MNGSSFFKELGRSFIVSSLLPASIFLIILGIIFRGFLPDRLVGILIGQGNALLGIAIMGMAALWLAYMLYSGQDSVFKLFEGYYYWFGYGGLLRKFQGCYFRKKHAGIEDYIELEQELGPDDEDVRKAFPKVRDAMQELELRTPIDKNRILPTKLGNILRASEDYPQSRYGINSLTLWPRMVKFLPKELTGELEEINNNLVFMLNSSLLSYFLSIATITVLLINLLGWLNVAPYESIMKSEEWKAGIKYVPIWLLLAISIVCRLGGWLFYRMGTNVAIEFGLYIRTTFDLYRHAFLEHMVETSPKDIEKEKLSWNNIGDFYVFGRQFGSRKFEIEKTPSKEPQQAPISLLIIVGLLVGFAYRIFSFRKQRRARIT